MARIDRLAEAPRRTLQLASVIGREFTRRLLDRLAELHTNTETYLQELKALELIYERSLFPELAYMFKHALIQDVTYNSLLVRRRQELHQLIGGPWKSCTLTVSPSSTRCWRIISPEPRCGTQLWTTF